MIDVSMLPNSIFDIKLQDEDKLTLKSRISLQKHVSEYENKIQSLQEKFIADCMSAHSDFEKNYECVRHMDSVFSKCDKDVNEAIISKRNNSTQLECPIIGCKKWQIKLKRHFQMEHTDLNVKERDYAYMMAQKMSNNELGWITDPKEADISSASLGSSDSKVSSDPNYSEEQFIKKNCITNLVSRRNNPKKCCICELLVTNLTEHFNRHHPTIKPSSTEYKKSLADSEVIPKCLTKLEKE